LCAVSFSDTVGQATSGIRCGCQDLARGAGSADRCSVNRSNRDTVAAGKRCRAPHNAAVEVRRTYGPPATRRETKAFTARAQERSGSNGCARNKASVSVVGWRAFALGWWSAQNQFHSNLTASWRAAR